MVVFAEFCAASKGRYDRVALVYDVRTGEPAQKLIDALEHMKSAGINCRMLFLEADTQSIINRYGKSELGGINTWQVRITSLARN